MTYRFLGRWMPTLVRQRTAFSYCVRLYSYTDSFALHQQMIRAHAILLQDSCSKIQRNAGPTRCRNTDLHKHSKGKARKRWQPALRCSYRRLDQSLQRLLRSSAQVEHSSAHRSIQVRQVFLNSSAFHAAAKLPHACTPHIVVPLSGSQLPGSMFACSVCRQQRASGKIDNRYFMNRSVQSQVHHQRRVPCGTSSSMLVVDRPYPEMETRILKEPSTLHASKRQL